MFSVISIIMEGFILAAGLGTRLRPLTDNKPKALVKVGDKTLLELTIHRLESYGIEHIVVNVHHHALMVIDFIKSHSWNAKIDISDESDMLMDTGAGLKKASPFFDKDEPVLVHNVDVLSKINLEELDDCHLLNHDLATLCVSRRETKRPLLFTKEGTLLGRPCENTQLTERTKLMAFSGISIVEPQVIEDMPKADHPYSITDYYCKSSINFRIGSYEHRAEDWLDVGKPETLAKAQAF